MYPNEQDESTHDERPSLRQALHSATGDRDAEAEALADRAAPEVDEEDAKLAVRRAHGDLGLGETIPERDIADVDDAWEAHDDRAS